MQWLKKNCELISLEEAQKRIRRGSNDRIAASVTFDDGYADNCDRALPLLIAEKIPCTYFVSLRNVLKRQALSTRFAARGLVPPQQRGETLLDGQTWNRDCGATRARMPDSGRITDECKLYDEVVVAGEELQSAIGSPVRYFSFPFGLPQNLSRRAFQMAYEYGYEAVCSRTAITTFRATTRSIAAHPRGKHAAAAELGHDRPAQDSSIAHRWRLSADVDSRARKHH